MKHNNIRSNTPSSDSTGWPPWPALPFTPFHKTTNTPFPSSVTPDAAFPDMFFPVFLAVTITTIFSSFLNVPANQKPSPHPSKSSFSSFQANYLVVYLLAVAADWLQGPYVYALYSHYGYQKSHIARLYIAGFASSAVFGTIFASMADRFGRRSNTLIYCLAYILSCVTKHSPNFHVLLLGRLLGGVAYSVLFSAFESWMVYEHNARGYQPFLLGKTFARAQFGNAVVAILAGQVAGWFAHRYGKVMPFDVSIAVLLLLAVIIATTWTENYGDPHSSVKDGFVRAWKYLITDEKICLLGISQAAFEGALYVFTFIWTPALQTAGGQTDEIPHGTIFSTFMAATMIGSNLFVCCHRYFRVELIMRTVFALGLLVFLAAIFSQSIGLLYVAFITFEVLCGVYFPAMGTMRAPYIPEQSRSAMLTFFRIPLNIIVVVTLYEDMEIRSVFILCASLMAIAVVSQQRLLKLTHSKSQDLDEKEAFTSTKTPEEEC